MQGAKDALLEERLQAFGSLVGLLLALITLFTAQRWSAVKEMAGTAEGSRLLRSGGWLLDVLLFLLTLILFGSGLPLALDSLSGLELLREASALRSAFAAVWVALLGLLAWQLALIYQSVDLAREKPPESSTSSTERK